MRSGAGIGLWRAALAAWTVFFVLLYAVMTVSSLRAARSGSRESAQATLYRTGAFFAGLAGLVALRITLRRDRPD
jgi:hypothetical protein